MITINGATISEAAIGRELQYHPAPSQEEAARQAATALIVRELLLQRAHELRIEGADEDVVIGELIAREITIPEPVEEEIERYYRQNNLRFHTSALYEAAHIFFPARQDDDEAREAAEAMAKAVLREVLATPQRFAELAKAHSACSSKEQGGFLGQISRGDTNPEIESCLSTMDPGTICAVPVPSRHGYHILRLDRRVDGRALELNQVRNWIADHLRQTSHRRAISQYLQILAAKAEITGFDLNLPDNFLVQ